MKKTIYMMAAVMAVGLAFANGNDFRTRSSSVTTNESGVVTRFFIENTVSTNGTLVTTQRRETRTETDENGNLLSTKTSEYVESVSIGDAQQSGRGYNRGHRGYPPRRGPVQLDRMKLDLSFMGLKPGDVFDLKGAAVPNNAQMLICVRFTPKKLLAGFDDYFVYLTPTSKRIVKIMACAKAQIPFDPDGSHYLLEALEDKYGAKPMRYSSSNAQYAINFNHNQSIDIKLYKASANYETIIEMRDNDIYRMAQREYQEILKDKRIEEWRERERRQREASEAF